ncbi:MAG: histidine-type phosphatase [Schwartzia sp.]|nr:histidine-type phosphatase [Schwartzia sp. (in: firmicutes)]
MRKHKIILWLCAFFVAFFTFAMESVQASGTYRLAKVLVLSRHNLRTPTSNGSKVLASLTPHAWTEWTGAPGELSMKGGQLETIMGQYFRQWLEGEGLIAANTVPVAGEMRFYANSFQRTVATAHYFSAGMLPMANVEVERHFALNEPDPVFLPPASASFSDEFRARAMREVEAMGGVHEFSKRMETNTRLIADVLDFKDSQYARENGLTTFPAQDMKFDFDTLRLTASLILAGRASDALSLQYYEAEEKDTVKAAFGHELTFAQWRDISKVKDMGISAYYCLPTMAKPIAAPLLSVMRDELLEDGRSFTFLCGHDTNFATVFPSLGIEEYTLPDTIEEKAPIGAKFVVEKRLGEDGQAYVSLKLIYQSAKQMQNREPLSPANPPVIVPLKLQGLQANEDGLYRFDEVIGRFAEIIAEVEAAA